VKALAIAAVNLRRLFRERATIFFVFVFPMLLILVLGAAFGGGFDPRVGVTGPDQDPLAEGLVAELEGTGGIGVVRFSSEEDLLTGVERGEVQGGLVIPEDYGEAIVQGRAVIRYFARPDLTGQQVALSVRSAVGEQASLLRAARFASQEQGMPLASALATAQGMAPEVPAVEVRTETAGRAVFPESLGRFDLGASSQLLLFIFLTSLTGSVALIETRRLGVSRRMLSTPTSARAILAGEALGRLGVAMVQGVFIMLGSALIFGVRWGDPLGAVALLVGFSLVASGAGMLLGAALRTEQQAGAMGLLLGLGVAALGGSMMPMEFFSETMRRVAHVTPHAWANDGFAELVRHGAGLSGILPQLGVLMLFAAGLFGLATWRLRRAITG
jgi:ABC-2 type transport system permease protein